MSILMNTTFITMSRHMEPYILHQLVKISDVLLLPLSPNAIGEVIVSMDRIKYRSAISINSLMDWNITTTPQMITSSHAAPSPANALSDSVVIATALGISIMRITTAVIFSAMSHICGLATSRNENTNVREKSSFGSSASKPSPVSILLTDWKTRLPIRSAQPTARKLCWSTGSIGMRLCRYAKSMLIMFKRAVEKNSQISRIRV